MKAFVNITRLLPRALVCLLITVMVFAALIVLRVAKEAGAEPSSLGGITTETLEGGVGTGASGDPQLDAARDMLARATPAERARLERFYEQLDDIDRETEIAVEEYNAARIRMDQLNMSVASAQSDYRLLEQAYALQGDKLAERAVDLYKGGESSLLRVLLEAKSFADFYSRIEYVTRISTLDADLMARIRNQRERLESTLQQLRIDQDEAASLEFELRARKIEVAERNRDRQQELKAQNQALLMLFEAGRTEERAQESRLALEIKSGALKDVVIEPGSPAETALAYRGIPYRWGGASRAGFDCSGLVMFVFSQHGVSLPHHSGSQALHGSKVLGTLEPNDVVFFGSPIHHVGIYIGGGYYVHAPRTGDVVKISKLTGRKDLVAARRYDWTPRVGQAK